MMWTVPCVMNGENITIEGQEISHALPVKASGMFMSTCGHFYCSTCAAYMAQKERSDPLECSECM